MKIERNGNLFNFEEIPLGLTKLIHAACERAACEWKTQPYSTPAADLLQGFANQILDKFKHTNPATATFRIF